MGIFSAAGRALGFKGKPKAFFENAYEGARFRRRLSGWQPSRASINQMLAADGGVLRSRCRDLVRNNPYAASAKESFVANLVGAGIKPSWLIDDKETKDYLQTAWRDWTDEADFDRLTDFYGLQALIAGALFEAGECFVRFHTGEDGELRLQVLESEMLEYEKNHTAPSGNLIINGIEVETGQDDQVIVPTSKRAAYWFYSVYPGDPYYRARPLVYVRVPAEEVLHIYRPIRPGQMRGVPWVTPSIVKLWLLDSYDDAELDRKRIAAMYAGFITSPVPEEFFGEDSIDAPPKPAPIADVPTLEPGTMQALEPGEDIKFSEPADVGGSYEPFQYRNLVSACSGMGVPYMAVTGDLSRANYSSQRGGLMEFRSRLEQLQHSTMVFQLCRPIAKRWLAGGVLSGELDLPQFATRRRDYERIKWIPPKFDWVDPLKDLQAEKLAVDNGFKARSDVIEATGDDREEVDRRRAADIKSEESNGLPRAIPDGAHVTGIDPALAPDETNVGAPQAQDVA